MSATKKETSENNSPIIKPVGKSGKETSSVNRSTQRKCDEQEPEPHQELISSADYRSYVIQGIDCEIPRQFDEGDELQYRTSLYGGRVMIVTVTTYQKDKNGKWEYQLRDSSGAPVIEKNSLDIAWIPEHYLKKIPTGDTPTK